MKLGAWLTAKEMLPSAFADGIGVDKSLVSRWLDGSVIPRRDNMRRIREFTNGEVTANDFGDDQEPIPNPNDDAEPDNSAPVVSAAE